MQHEPGSLIFPGMKQRMPLSAMSLTAVLRRMGRGDLTAHGSRSTFHDWAVEATASRIMFSSKRWHMRSALQWRPPIAAAIFAKRVELMAAWAAYCTGEGEAGIER